MPDIAVIGAAIQAVKAATTAATHLRDVSNKLDQAELRLRLADVISALADARMELAAVGDEVRARDERIRELEAARAFQDKLTFDGRMYWLGVGREREGPFCQRCNDIDAKSVRLISQSAGYWNCRGCDSNYRDSKAID